MSERVSPDGLAAAIMEALEEYEGVTEEAARAGITETAKAAVEELKSAHPSGSGQYGSWDAYNNDWTTTKTKSSKKSFGAIVHNKKHYQLAHLLENGHALRGGGRTIAFTHIAPVAERAEEDLIKNIKHYL